MAFRNVLLTVVSGYCSTLTVATVEQKSCALDKGKHCPSFGDTQDRVECCPSKIESGEYYCCSVVEKRRTEYAQGEVDENTGEIVGIAIGSLLVVVTLVLLCCFFCSCCILYRYRHRRRQDCVLRWTDVRTASIVNHYHNHRQTMLHGRSQQLNHNNNNNDSSNNGASSFLQSYHPLPLAGPKPYEAPPPYPFAQQYPPFNHTGMTSTVVPFNDFIIPGSPATIRQSNDTPKLA